MSSRPKKKSGPGCHVLPGITLEPYFRRIKKLGAGSFGTVYSAYVTAAGKRLNRDMPDVVAVKEINLPTIRERINALRNEFHILKRIPKSYFGCFTTGGEKVYVILPLIEGLDLFKVDLYGLNEIKLARDIARAITDLHALNIVHRDIKLENIMYNPADRSVHLIDFGLACDLSRNPRSPTCRFRDIGTPGYIDPHVRPGDLASMKLADWWAYGQLLVELFLHVRLWNGKTRRYGQLNQNDYHHLPKKFRPLLFGLTDPSLAPFERPTPEEIIHVAGLRQPIYQKGR
jgi:serine/threonine protein kinase